MRRAFALLSVALLAAGCGNGTVNGLDNSFDGTVSGQSLSVRSSIFDVISLDDGNGGTVQVLKLLLADKPDICATLSGGSALRSTTLLTLTFFTLKADRTGLTDVTTGSFDVSADLTHVTQSDVAAALFSQSDASCQDTLDPSTTTGTAGSAVLKAFDSRENGVASGSFALQFTGDDQGTGVFGATWCDLQSTVSSPPTTCP